MADPIDLIGGLTRALGNINGQNLSTAVNAINSGADAIFAKERDSKAVPPGGIDLKEITIKSSSTNRSFDIRAIVIEFNVFTSITQPFLTAYFTILDSLSLQSILPITGDETITLKYSSIGASDYGLDEVDLKLEVVELKDVILDDARTVQYIIKAVSVESIQNISSRVKQSYPQQSVSEMVKSIYENYLMSSKELKTWEQSVGDRTIVIPNMYPEEAISFLCREAKPNSGISSFCFFEDIDGFHFVTVDSLMGGMKKGKTVNDYYFTEKDYSLKGSEDGIPFELKKVVNFQFTRMFSIEQNLISGAFANSVMIVNPVNSLFEQKDFKYKDDNSRFQRTNNGKIISNQSAYSKISPDIRTSLFLSNKNTNTELDIQDTKWETYSDRLAAIGLMNNTVLEITVPGDSGKRPGQKIKNICFPEWSATDDKIGEEHKYFSGEYLITSVRDFYSIGGGYYTVLQCVRNAYKADVEGGEQRNDRPNDPQFSEPSDEPKEQFGPPMPESITPTSPAVPQNPVTPGLPPKFTNQPGI